MEQRIAAATGVALTAIVAPHDFLPHRVESARRQGYRPDELVRIIDEVS
jgi:hypothetical protein